MAMKKKEWVLMLSALSMMVSSLAFALPDDDEPVVSSSTIQLNDVPKAPDAMQKKELDSNSSAASPAKMPQEKVSPESLRFQQVRELVYYYAAARVCSGESKSSPLHENIRMALVKSQDPTQQNLLIDLLYQGHTGHGLGIAMAKDNNKARCQDTIAQYQQLIKQGAEAKLNEMFHITLHTPAPEKKVEDEVNGEEKGIIPPASSEPVDQ